MNSTAAEQKALFNDVQAGPPGLRHEPDFNDGARAACTEVDIGRQRLLRFSMLNEGIAVIDCPAIRRRRRVLLNRRHRRQASPEAAALSGSRIP